MLLFTEAEEAAVRAGIEGVWVGGGGAKREGLVEDLVGEDCSRAGGRVSARKESVSDVIGWSF